MIEVVYLCSHGRSGSSLVGSVIGLLEGYCFIGEGRDVWRDGLVDNQQCGCGASFRECPFWTAVFARGFGGMDSADTREAQALFDRYDRHLPAGLGSAEGYASVLDKLYRAIAEVSGARVIVDSSKTLRYAALLRAVPSLKVRLVNVIRDPRGIVHSRSGQARYRDGSTKPAADAGFGRHRTFRVIAKWTVRNLLCGLMMSRYGGIRVIYEGFVRDQRPMLVALAGEAAADKALSRLRDGTENIVQHQVAGNWVRGLSISLKESWRAELPWFPSFVAGTLSWPLRQLFRFRVYTP